MASYHNETTHRHLFSSIDSRTRDLHYLSLIRRTIYVPLIIMLLSSVCALLLFGGGGGVSAFATTNKSKRYGIPASTQQTKTLPSINGRHIHSRSSCSTSTELYNLLDAVGDMLSGPKLEAETNLPFDPPFCNDISCSNGVRTFAVKERPISFTGEDFDIVEITNGNEEDFVRVRGAMLHLPGKDKMRLSCSNCGEQRVTMDRVMIAATPSYNLIRENDNTKIGWIEKKLISFMDTFDVYMEGEGGFGVTGLFKPTPAYRIEGDFLDRNFVFKNKEGNIVAKAGADGWIQLDMMNHYQIQVAEGMDALLVLACVCCIDEEFDEEHQKRREERER